MLGIHSCVCPCVGVCPYVCVVAEGACVWADGSSSSWLHEYHVVD